MSDIQQDLASRVSDALVAAFGDEHRDVDPLVGPATNPEFGDYQANLAMGLAKRLRQAPRKIAEAIVEKLDVEGICDGVEIAGPGFINLTIATGRLQDDVRALAGDERLGVRPATDLDRIVIDYSSPNAAKEMHVGHIRSTCIGDALTRVLEFLGHDVIRHNHLGDWGTQFGMLVELLFEEDWTPESSHSIGNLMETYQRAKQRDDENPDFARRARERVVELQGGDEKTLAAWSALLEASRRHMNEVYRRLGVLLVDEDIRGESFYNDRLADVVSELDAAGALVESEGARVVFPEGFQDREGDPLPMIVQKSDGGFLYSTTDLAAALHRIRDLGATRVIYVVDARQSDHFRMLFQTLRQVGWAPPEVRLEHVSFGTILGKDNRPFKTREGGTISLMGLLDDAEARAEAVIAEKQPELDEAGRREIAEPVAIGAVKFADLASDRIKDYVFDLDRMLALEGRTAPYLQNAYVRIRGIFRKGEIDEAELDAGALAIADPAERGLAVKLLQLPGVLRGVADALEPHRLCTYLCELAAAYHRFYEHCPVLAAEDEATRASRLVLCLSTARTMARGLSLLGIPVLERM